MQDQVAKTKSVQFKQADKRVVDAHVVYESTGQSMILGADLSREEYHVQKQPESEEPLRKKHFAIIMDQKTKQFLYLYPDEQIFSRITANGMVSGNDLYRKFRDVPAARTEKLPEKIVDGKKVIGFVLKESVDQADKTTWAETTTYWVDETTKLPVRIEYSGRNKDSNAHESYETARTDFIFDAPLDESLFSTDPPKGWKDVSERFVVPIK